MPVERFFAGGNVAMSPNPQHTVYPGSNTSGAPTISKFITLSPNKLSRIANASTPGGDTSSPHTISSNSVSANSSSSSETKKPLKFEIREEGGRGRGEQQIPFDEPPVSRCVSAGGGVGGRGGETSVTASSLIKPRISKVGQHQQQRVRPPMIQRPPQSPRKQDTASTITFGRVSAGSRTPTRTPPPSSSYKGGYNSGANTPCSPPIPTCSVAI